MIHDFDELKLKDHDVDLEYIPEATSTNLSHSRFFDRKNFFERFIDFQGKKTPRLFRAVKYQLHLLSIKYVLQVKRLSSRAATLLACVSEDQILQVKTYQLIYEKNANT